MQKELTQQKTIQQQNKKQNADVLTKTAPVMVQKENTDAAFDKLLRRPRSKKKLKLYAEVDLPSMADEEIMERMRKELQSGTADGSSWGASSQGEGVQEDIAQEDIAAFLMSRQEEFIKMIQGEIREEERLEEERKRLEAEEKGRRKIGVLSQCCITGRYVHICPFPANAGSDISWNNVIHLRRGEAPAAFAQEFQKALHLYESCNCNCVEMYGNRVAAIAKNGEVIKIEKI